MYQYLVYIRPLTYMLLRVCFGNHVTAPLLFTPAGNKSAWTTSVLTRELQQLSQATPGISIKIGVQLYRQKTCVIMGRTMFRMLIGQLLYLNKQQETEIWRESGLVDLITDDKDKVLGVLAEKDGKKVRLGAKNGVLLASGGFAKNSSMRETFQKKGKHTSWSAASAGDTGDAITVGQKLGAAVELMDKAWWMPMIMVGETPIFDLSVRSFPHSTVVDGSGSRYLNESGCYNDFGEAMNKHHDTNAAAVPPWIILDQAHAYAFKKSGPTLLRGLPWRKRVAVNFKL